MELSSAAPPSSGWSTPHQSTAAETALSRDHLLSLGTEPSLGGSYFQLSPAGSRRPAISPYLIVRY